MKVIEKTKDLAKRAGNSVNKNATTWLTVASAVGFVATVVVACKQTTKLEGILDTAKENIADIKEAKADGFVTLEYEDGTAEKIPYSVEDGKKDLTITYAKTTGQIVRLYMVPAVIGTLTLIAMFQSDNIARKRKLELSAAYAALNTAFQNYRENVVERYGEEMDEKILCGVRETEVTETKTKKDGTEVTKTKKVELQDATKMNPYYFFFQEGVDGWTKDAQVNRKHVCMRLNDCMTIFQGKHYLTWNDVRKVFHLGPVPGGDTVGFVWDDSLNFNDNTENVLYGFGLYDPKDEAMRAFGESEGNVLIMNKHIDYDIQKTMRDRLYAKHKRERSLNNLLTDDIEQDILDGKISL